LRKKILCLEFIGIWGSGKTTLVRKVTKELNDLGVYTLCYDNFVELSRFQRYSKGFLLFVTNPIIVSNFFYLLTKIFFKCKPIDKFQFEIFFTIIKVSLAKYILLKKKPNILLWEGDYHLLTMFKKMTMLPKKDLLLFSGTTINSAHIALPIFINISISKAKKRVLEDQKSGVYRFSRADMKMLDVRYKYMIDNQKYLNQIFSDYSIHHAAIKGTEKYEINSQDLEILIHKIREYL